jgi:hypothetical protein
MLDLVNTELQMIADEIQESLNQDLYDEWIQCMIQAYYPPFDDWE